MRIFEPPLSFPPVEHEKRIKALLKTLRRLELDGALIVSETARFYYTGFQSSNGLLVVDTRAAPRLLTDFRYLPAAKQKIPFMDCADIQRPPESAKLLARLTASWQRAAIEHSLPHAQFNTLTQPLAHVTEWADAAPVIAAQRAIKSAREQKAIRHSVAVNDVIFQTIAEQLKPGVTEWQVRAQLRMLMGVTGEMEAFDPIVAFGANAAECHHACGADELAARRAVLLDIGVKCNGYCSDLTRTFCLGKPSRQLAEIHDVVLRANRAAAAKIRPGMTGAEADGLARDVIEKAGYGKAFGHGLGHGVGLEVHEAPSLSPTYPARLEPGHIVTIEPGIYLPGATGVRIEDIALITKDGCEILSSAPRGLSLP